MFVQQLSALVLVEQDSTCWCLKAFTITLFERGDTFAFKINRDRNQMRTLKGLFLLRFGCKSTVVIRISCLQRLEYYLAPNPHAHLELTVPYIRVWLAFLHRIN